MTEKPIESKKKWALISVSDKKDLDSIGKKLVDIGYNIIGSQGTVRELTQKGIPACDISELIGMEAKGILRRFVERGLMNEELFAQISAELKGPQLLGDRVKTLSRELYAGLLANELKPEHVAEMVEKELLLIDLIYCNFYPMRKFIDESNKLDNRDAAIDLVVENTDIGGPCMVHAAAKGLRIVVNRYKDMQWVLRELEETGDISREHRQVLRARAEFVVAEYIGHSAMFHGNGKFSIISGELVETFKGENGAQSPAGLYSFMADDPLAIDKFKLIVGAEQSLNNKFDATRLLQTLTHIASGWNINYGAIPFIAIGVKHGNACGACVSDSMKEAVVNAVKGDTKAIFGGSIMANFYINTDMASGMAEAMPNDKAVFDGVTAAGFDEGAIKCLSRIKGKCRIVGNESLFFHDALRLDTTPILRSVRGGFTIQPNYTFVLDFKDPDLQVFGERNPNFEKDLLLAWAIGCTSNSNTITIVKNQMLIGNGVGQQDRVGASKLAIERAIDAGHKDKLEGSAAYSDSFFPFPDAVEALIRVGVKAIFSTTGSVNDKIIQELCIKNNVVLYQLPDTKARGFFGHG